MPTCTAQGSFLHAGRLKAIKDGSGSESEQFVDANSQLPSRGTSSSGSSETKTDVILWRCVSI